MMNFKYKKNIHTTQLSKFNISGLNFVPAFESDLELGLGLLLSYRIARLRIFIIVDVFGPGGLNVAPGFTGKSEEDMLVALRCVA